MTNYSIFNSEETYSIEKASNTFMWVSALVPGSAKKNTALSKQSVTERFERQD